MLITQKTEVRKLRSMKPTINQFQKEIQNCIDWKKTNWWKEQTNIGNNIAKREMYGHTLF